MNCKCEELRVVEWGVDYKRNVTWYRHECVACGKEFVAEAINECPVTKPAYVLVIENDGSVSIHEA